MSKQKIHGLIVTNQKVPLLEKSVDKEQCYICGFTFEKEDCMVVYIDADLTDKRKVHQKCIHNHLQLLPKDTQIAVVSEESNEILSYTTVSQKT